MKLGAVSKVNRKIPMASQKFDDHITVMTANYDIVDSPFFARFGTFRKPNSRRMVYNL